MAIGVGNAENWAEYERKRIEDERKRSEELDARNRVYWIEPLTMKLQNILVGDTPKAQDALDELFGDLKEEKILWYPSAGFDYRDILEMTAPRRELHGIKEPPNIICHTDYSPGLTGLDKNIIVVYPGTTVRIMEKYALSLQKEAQVVYRVNPEYAYLDGALLQPKIYLLKLRITSDTLGEIPATVLFFLFENHNFLEEVILKHGLRITHFVKVRDGSSFGGNGMCSSVFYPLLGNIGVKYLIADEKIDRRGSVYDDAGETFPFPHKSFSLRPTGSELYWSSLRVRIFEVMARDSELTREELAEILDQISDSRGPQ